MTVNAHRTAIIPADRGSRQHLKIMQLLAAVDGDGSTPLVETLVATAGRLRRGMTAIVITPSTDRDVDPPDRVAADPRDRDGRRDGRRRGVRPRRPDRARAARRDAWRRSTRAAEEQRAQRPGRSATRCPSTR